MKKSVFALALVLAVLGCSSLVVDPSIQAVDANDYTLATSACEAAPGGGMDICRVTEGTKIESSWVMIVPSGKGIAGGEVDVYYRDIHKNYPVTGKVVEIPWRDFFGADLWSRDMDGEALALVLVRFKTPEGLQEIAKFRGIAKIVVTKPGYDRMPIDSGFAGWKTTCKIQYSTAGRGAISCK
jgi:hypothetical protein